MDGSADYGIFSITIHCSELNRTVRRVVFVAFDLLWVNEFGVVCSWRVRLGIWDSTMLEVTALL